MTPGRYYRHRNNKTVAIEVHRSFYVPERKRWNVKVTWWSWSPTTGLRFSMHITERFDITKEQCPNWEMI